MNYFILDKKIIVHNFQIQFGKKRNIVIKRFLFDAPFNEYP
jgi:hypothetical protein